MKSLSNRDPYKVGLALILAIVLGGVALVFLSSMSLGMKTHYVVLQNSGGLRAGEAVEVSGVEVGKVDSITINYDKADASATSPDTPTVLVKFEMDSDIELGDQSQATVKVATLLGTHYLEIAPAGTGSVSKIAIANTDVPYQLQDALDKGSEVVGKLDAPTIAKSLVVLADNLDASKGSLGPALEGVSALSGLLERRGDDLGKLLTAAAAVSKELKDNAGDVTVLMQQANLVLAELNSRQDAIKQLLGQSVNLANTVSGLIKNSRADLKPALTSLDQVIQMLNGQAKQIQSGIDLLAPSARYIANATGNGPWVDLWGHEPLLPADDVAGGLE